MDNKRRDLLKAGATAAIGGMFSTSRICRSRRSIISSSGRIRLRAALP